MSVPVSDIQQAYEYCEALTGRRESNFSIGFGLLPDDKRLAIHVVYAICRFVDDISDEDSKDPEKLLNAWVGELNNIYAGTPTHPIGIAMADLLQKFNIPREGVQELIDGCIRDQHIKRYQTFKELSYYCELVATSIAKVSLPVYGFEDYSTVFPLGRDLSYAFQLTNIIRDVAEDLDEKGRVYLPQDELDRFGLTAEAIVAKEDPDKIKNFYSFWAQRCKHYFDSGYQVIQYLDEDAKSCVRAMHGAYYRLLEKIITDPIQSLSKQTVLTGEDKEKIIEEALRG